jgi:hypothetical protein
VLAGRTPRHVVNIQVLGSPLLRGKLERHGIAWQDPRPPQEPASSPTT